MTGGLHHVEHGPADAPTLVVIHPLGASLDFWDDCVAAWCGRYRVVACDLRGAGRSPVPDRPWGLDDHARDVTALCDALSLDGFVLVGCAIGSLVAAACAAARPERVRALVLCDTTPRLGLDSKERTEARVRLVEEQGIEALLPSVIDMAFEGLPKDARYRRYLERYRRNTAEGYSAIALGMIGTDITDRLAGLDLPCLVVVGANDILLAPALSREVHELVAGSEFETIENAAHFPPYQAPEAFAGLVSGFLDRRVFA